VTGIITAALMARIWPLASFPDTYYAEVGKQIHEIEPKGIKRSEWALRLAVQKAQSADGFGATLYKGVDMFLGIIFALSPLVMAWGTIALIIATYTPIFNWISLPFGYYLQLFGLEEAFQAAPATIVGFADMFIPAILAAGLTSVRTKFVVGVLSLVQIIYMTEVGTIMLTSKMPVTFKDLAIIFLQKTILAIPIIVLMATLFGIA
jgi:nucleoside recognition membrane protein YjiH